jgi:hypothetical protein
MPALMVDGLQFEFPPGWRVEKYDEWSFYRNQFGMPDGIKVVSHLRYD